MLYLRTFGGLSLHPEPVARALGGGHRARHALLAVLAVAGERGISRDRLFALFWPESNAARARGSLKQTLYTLRGELGERELTQGVDVLRLNSKVIGSDIADFDAAIRARDCERAVGLYSGPFLDGIHLSGLPELDDWMERERTHLAAAYARVLRDLAQQAEGAGDDPTAVGWWKQLAASDRLTAGPALSLIKALARTGDRVAALQHARAYQALVRAELDIDPDPAIEALAERLRSGVAQPADLAGFVANGRHSGNENGIVLGSPAESVEPAARTSDNILAGPGLSLNAPASRRAIPGQLLVWSGALGVLLVGLIMGAMAAGRPGAEQALMRFPVDLGSYVRLAAVPAPVALSPDGSILAMVVARDSGPPRIAVRPVGDLQLRDLPGTDGASQLFFSPDGQWIGFHTQGGLRKVPILGGTPVLIGSVPEMFGAAWTADDQIVVSTEEALAVIPAAGGVPVRISAPDTAGGEIGQRWPLVLRDGTIIYTARGRILERSRVGVIPKGRGRQQVLDSLPGTAPLAMVNGHLILSTARNLLTPRNAIIAVRWDDRRMRPVGASRTMVEQVGLDLQGAISASVSASGSLVYYFAPEDRYQLVLANTRGEQRLAMPDSGPFAFPRFSPDGKRIAVNVVAQGNHVKVLNRESGTFTMLTSGQAGYPEWTPDGKRVVFLRPPGNGGLWSKPADLSGPEQLLIRSGKVDIKEGVFSRDGRTLVVRGNNVRDTTHEVWYRKYDGDTTLRPLLTGRGVKVGPRISPDGMWIAYSTAESGRHVVVTPLNGPGPKHQVSVDQGWSPVWAPDGRRLYYFRGQQLIAATLRFSPSFAVVSREVVLDGPFAAHGYHAQFDISPDGQEFALLRDVSPDSRLIFVHGWERELRRNGATAGARMARN